MDTRGHGASDAPAADYSLKLLADDVVAVMDAACVDRAWIAGLSLGGMMAMQMGLDYPSRVAGLVLVCTSAAMDASAWADRIARVRADGMAGIAEFAMARFLSPGFAAAHPATAATLLNGLLAISAAGYAGAGAAIRDMDLIARLGDIAAPTLVVTGTRDVSTPFAPHGQALVDRIPGAAHIALDTAHLAPLEAPGALAAAVRNFCLRNPVHEQAADTLFAAGLANRARILGDVWVEQSLALRTPFNADFQAMITRIAWHEVWGRPGLDDRTRRLLVVAITAALGRWEEFGLHVRAGLARGGFTADELKEVLMQTAIYAGVPAANTGFSAAGKIIAEMQQPGGLP
jgi:3-oxoadipate enol-lactonase/4-carboxymuconolactone decarboxylase